MTLLLIFKVLWYLFPLPHKGVVVTHSIRYSCQQLLVFLAVFAVFGNVLGEQKVTLDSQINEIYDALDCIQENLNLVRETGEAQQGQGSLKSAEFHPRCRLSSQRPAQTDEINGKNLLTKIDKLTEQVESNRKQINQLTQTLSKDQSNLNNLKTFDEANEAFLASLKTHPPKQEPPVSTVDYSAVSSSTGNPCLGFISLKGSQDIVYKLPDQFPLGYRDVCLWVVWATNGGPIRVEILPDPAVAYQDDFQVTVNYAYTPMNSVPQNL